MTHDPGDPRRLEAEDDVLQVMYWLRGEGIAPEVTPADLARFVSRTERQLAEILERLASLGLVDARADHLTPRFALTAEGVREGGRRFADEFAGITRPGHGECGDPACDCRQTGNPADCRHHA